MEQSAVRGLVSAARLQHLAGQVRVVDARFHLPGTLQTAAAAYNEEHIAGAVFFDHNLIRDAASPYPSMLPSPEDFATHMGTLGLRPTDTIVVYDAHTRLGAARAWWMLTVYGHKEVYVLDGGLAAWRAAGGRVHTQTPVLTPTPYPLPVLRRPLLADKVDVERAVATGSPALVDARSPARFSGTEPEPRADMRSGHIPGSVNIYYQRLYQEDGRFQPPPVLRTLFAEAGINPAAPFIATCGSGISACAISLARYTLGYDPAPVYDGSWAQWGRVEG